MQLTQNREDENLMGILLYYKSFLPCGIKHHWSGFEIKIEILRGIVICIIKASHYWET